MMNLKNAAIFEMEPLKRLASLLIGLSLLLAGCQSAPQVTAPSNQTGTYAVDTLFREYYADLGGEERIGPAISPLIEENNLKCQYTVAVLMCLNPEVTGSGRYYLSSLGSKIGVHDAPPTAPEQESTQVVDGYPIYPGFIKMINNLRGLDVIGKPLTTIRYNYQQQRVEQYFENAGFYYRFDDAADAVNLLPYGWYYCGRACQYDLSENRTFNPVKQTLETPFAHSLERIGGLKMFGQPLTEPYTTADGALEQVYENIVVYGSRDKPNDVHLRPLSRLLSMISTPPGPKKYGVEQNVIFYPVDGELGYHVPIVFDQFISQHGGLEFSGAPIADTMYYEKDIPRQCFENFCLDYHPTAAAGMQVRMTPLGSLYLEAFTPLSAIPTAMPQTNLSILASEEAAQISGQEKQIINVTTLNKDTQEPQGDVNIILTLTLPDGSQSNVRLQATDAQGRTTAEIPAMPALPNGSMVVYQACSDEPGNSGACAYGAYLIWNSTK